MADAQSKLLTNLETEVRHLMSLYQKIKKERDELTAELEKVEQELSDTQDIAQDWETKYQNLKLAKIVSISEQEARKTQNRLSKLEREIEKCIALLNE
jgi:predicted  nucleic acid-binding Zn-ribbon protein